MLHAAMAANRGLVDPSAGRPRPDGLGAIVGPGSGKGRDLVELYNEKFARPATAIMAELYKANKLTPAPMDGKLEWTYYELWHHEGRRARHGASMSGPDYAWWHGMYEVAKTFYLYFIPEVRQVAGEPLATQLVEKYVFSQPGHRWLKEGMTKDQLQKIQEFYRQRYGEQK